MLLRELILQINYLHLLETYLEVKENDIYDIFKQRWIDVDMSAKYEKGWSTTLNSIQYNLI